MPRPKHMVRPTDEEEIAIQAGIAADPDNPEWTDDMFARARPASEMVPHLVPRRGKQRTPTKQMVSIRLDQDLLLKLRQSGRGWQARVNDLLRKATLP